MYGYCLQGWGRITRLPSCFVIDYHPETIVNGQNKIGLQISAQVKSLLYDCMTTVMKVHWQQSENRANAEGMSLLHEAISAVFTR